ncbi:MAG: hypothetical protein K0R05_3321 [Anaerocolumna sp.]|jgi:hypothetical protein|nr:hypothetical protein [Anaerocolumna sp.]
MDVSTKFSNTITTSGKITDYFSKRETPKVETQPATDSFESLVTEYAGLEYPSEIKNRVLSVAGNAPYSDLADSSGQINYNGVTFQCDYRKNALCLGDMSDDSQVLTIPLSAGGSLKVNVNSLDGLGRAIGMFSPKDQKRIMDALALYAKVKNKQDEMESEIVKVYKNLTVK